MNETEAFDAWTIAMDVAARAVVALGYDPRTDCVLEHHDLGSPTGFPDVRHVLVVRGVPAFEVTCTWRKDGEYQWTCTAEPKMLTWPEPTRPLRRVSVATPQTAR